MNSTGGITVSQYLPVPGSFMGVHRCICLWNHWFSPSPHFHMLGEDVPNCLVCLVGNDMFRGHIR